MQRTGMTRRLACLAALLVIAPAPVAFAAPLILITPDEARLPPPREPAIPMSARGVTRGPQVEYVAQGSPVTSPTHFQLKFFAHGGAAIDPASVQMTYLRDPTVDLTTRIKPYVTTFGVDVPDAIVPPGSHAIRIDLKDSDGRQGSLEFVLIVAPQ